MARTLRRVAYVWAACLVVATLLRLGDTLNLFATPPTFPDSANLVDRVLGSIPYRAAIWPVFAAENLLIAVAFLVLAPLSALLRGVAATADGMVRVATTTIAAAGVLGAAGQLLLVGAVDVTITEPYCDCGFKETEVVSQFWAQNLIGGGSNWMVAGALILAAVGLLMLGRVWAGNARSAAGNPWLGQLSYVAGALLVAQAILTVTGWLDPLPDYVSLVTTGIVVPIWAVVVGRDAAMLAAGAAGA